MKSLVLGGGRWVAPGAAPLVALAATWLAVTLALVGAYRWVRGAAPGPEVLADAARLSDSPIALDEARDVAWAFAMRHAETGTSIRSAGLEPPLPPPLCLPDDTTGLDAAIGDLERSLTSGVPRIVERRLAELRAVDVQGSEDGPRLQTFALARGHLAAGDAATAAQLLEPQGGGPLDGDRVPVVGADRAPELVAGGAVDPDRAAVVVHARYLAGLAALRRGRAADAIPHLRFAVNALSYLVSPADANAASSARSRRLAVDPGRFRCRDLDERDALESLDAYTALVAAYLAADDFSDPTRLGAELHRSALEADPGDPLARVLAAAKDGRLQVGENLLWAASNLQRLEHHNRIRPDARLALSRGRLVLGLTEASEPTSGFSRADACAVLEGMAAGAGAAASTAAEPTAVDSALAGVTLAILARRSVRCGLPDSVEADVRSRLLLLGGRSVAGGLPGRLETSRIDLEQALARGTGATAADFTTTLALQEADRALLRRGRIPADLLRGLSSEEASAAADTWYRAVFGDVARALVPLVGSPAGTRRPARESRVILSALGGAVAHAGLRPSVLYGPGQVVWAARSGGPELIVPHLARFAARSYPRTTVVLLAALFLAGGLLGLLVHVSWWRYELTTSRRFYVMETLERWSREMVADAPNADGGGR